MNKKFLRVMDGLKSNAGGFEYKLDEINIAKIWNPNKKEPKDFGGFNFSTEDKILRWLHRGDTIYDVIVPSDAELILCDKEKGIYRANKIIVTNPRKITDEMVLDFYKKTTLPNKVIAQCLQTLLWKNRIEISKYIIKDRVNNENIDEYITEFENYLSNGVFKYEELQDSSKEIYDILKEIQDPLSISLYVNKEPYYKKISKDKIINITGESGSGKTTYTNQYLNNDNYIVIDTDELKENIPTNNKNCIEFKNYLKRKYKENIPDLCTDFSKIYKDILNYYNNTDKTIVIDSAQFRNLRTDEEINLLKGEMIIIRTCIDECYNRCINRWKNKKHDYQEEELEKYKNKKSGMYKWYKSLNIFIKKVNEV